MQTFGVDLPGLEEQLQELILAGKIKARIDSRNGSLTVSSHTFRTDAYNKAIEAGTSVEDSLVRMLLTNSILKGEIVPTDPRKREGAPRFQ